MHLLQQRWMKDDETNRLLRTRKLTADAVSRLVMNWLVTYLPILESRSIKFFIVTCCCLSRVCVSGEFIFQQDSVPAAHTRHASFYTLIFHVRWTDELGDVTKPQNINSRLAVYYRVGQKSELHALHITSSNIGRFKNSFTVIISRKFAMQWSLTIPPHLKRVATLPCEMFVRKLACSVRCGA